MRLIPRIAAFTFLIGTLAACTTQKSTEEMLEDESQRVEIMTKISEDPELMMEMHDYMKESDHAMMKDTTMMMDPEKMAKKMSIIMKRMAEDSVVCMEMTGMMMQDKHMKAVMMSMCEDAGMTLGKGIMKGDDHMEMHRKGSM